MKKHWAAEYVDELRDRAKGMRKYGDERGATIAELHATEIEERVAAFDDEELEIDEAAEISGYHPESLKRLRREGEWSGRRRDLPRHPGKAVPALVSSAEEGGTDRPRSIAERIHRRHA